MMGKFGKLANKLRDISSFFQLVQKKGRPDILLYYGAGLGDDLMCTTVMREMHKSSSVRIWMMSNASALFLHNPDVEMVVPENDWLFRNLSRFQIHAVAPRSAHYDPVADRDIVDPNMHLLSVMCRQVGIKGEIKLRPYLYLSEEEKAKGAIAPNQVVIHSTGMGARFAIPLKEWRVDRFQQVVNALKDEFNFVQLGTSTDPLLDGALDLRGKTSLREAAAIISQSMLFVGLVGFLMHVSRAVDCRSVIIYGGRESPMQSGYPCFENIYTPMECSPCWKGVKCDFHHACMEQIQPNLVIDAIRRQISLKDVSLAEDRTTI